MPELGESVSEGALWFCLEVLLVCAWVSVCCRHACGCTWGRLYSTRFWLDLSPIRICSCYVLSIFFLIPYFLGVAFLHFDFGLTRNLCIWGQLWVDGYRSRDGCVLASMDCKKVHLLQWIMRKTNKKTKCGFNLNIRYSQKLRDSFAACWVRLALWGLIKRPRQIINKYLFVTTTSYCAWSSVLY